MEQNKKVEFFVTQNLKVRVPRFHHDDCYVLDEGKTIEILVTTPNNQLGKIVLPWEEIDRIRQFGWKQQEDAAKKVMKSKRVHCRHLKRWHILSPASCQIGKDAGPKGVNCITCK